MGNLGAYQWITTLAKKVGGPKNLVVLVGAAGYGAGKGIEFAVKAVVNKVKSAETKSTAVHSDEEVFTVTAIGTAAGGLSLRPGNKFRVLSSDGDAILIEVLGNANNPYFVSAVLLRSISDFVDQV